MVNIDQQITITVLKNRIRVKTPYNEVFSARMKNIPGHKFDFKYSKAWTIPLDQEQAVRELIADVYHVTLDNMDDQTSSPTVSIPQPRPTEPSMDTRPKTVPAADKQDIWDMIFARQAEILDYLGVNPPKPEKKKQRGNSITSSDNQQYTLLSDPVLRFCDGQYEYYALAKHNTDGDKYILYWPIGTECPANPLDNVKWDQFSYTSL